MSIEEYENIIRAAVEGLVADPENLLIRCTDKPESADASRDIHFLIACPEEDLGKLIGRHGSVADAVRTVINVRGRDDHKRIHVKFKDFNSEEDDEKESQ